MRALGETLEKARNAVSRDPNGALVHLEEAGAQVGNLQVGCCTEARMPLYATLLEGLTRAQLSINRELGRGH